MPPILLINRQQQATTGREPRSSQASLVRSLSPVAFQRRESELRERGIELAEQRAADARRQQTIGNVIQGVGTIGSGALALETLAPGTLGKAASALGLGSGSGAAGAVAPASAGFQTAGAAGAAGSATAGTSSGALGAAAVPSANAGVASGAGASAAAGGGGSAGAGAPGVTFAGAGGVAAGAGLTGFGAGQLTRRFSGLEGINARLAGAGAGAAAGAGTGAALGTFVFPGVGTALGAGIGAAVGGLTGGACIIVTASYGPDSEEVQVAREYRDLKMSQAEIRGYYILASGIAPEMEANEEYRIVIRRTLVEPLICYGRFVLGHSDEPPTPEEVNIVQRFLDMCRALGEAMPSFTRPNGEVV